MKISRLVLLTAAGVSLLASGAGASSIKVNGQYSGHFPGGIGTVEMTFHNGQLKAFKAAHVRVNDANCTQTSSFDMTGPISAGWKKPKLMDGAVKKHGSFSGRLDWKPENTANSSGASALFSGTFKSSTSAKIHLSFNWTYSGPGGYYYQCYTGYLAGTLKR